MSDSTLEQAVMSALAGNRRVRADEIAVQAIDGVVILRAATEPSKCAGPGHGRPAQGPVPVPLDELESRISGGDGQAR